VGPARNLVRSGRPKDRLPGPVGSAGDFTRLSTGPKGGALHRKISGFHQDERLDWVADLECGHGQHVRHKPPWTLRPWVVTPEGREKWLGAELDCKRCDELVDPEEKPADP
jgi:hypothetical protein